MSARSPFERAVHQDGLIALPGVPLMRLQPGGGLLLVIELKPVALAVDSAINDPTLPAIVHLVFDLHCTGNLATAERKSSVINATLWLLEWRVTERNEELWVVACKC